MITTLPSRILRQVIGSTFDFHESNPLFTRIIRVENINNARFLKKSQFISGGNRKILRTLERLLQRGVDQGLFRSDIGALDMHYLISSLCMYRLSNRETFGSMFNYDFNADHVRETHRSIAVETVLALITREGARHSPARRSLTIDVSRAAGVDSPDDGPRDIQRRMNEILKRHETDVQKTELA
ncbi:hypothetical protein [Caballeronia sp. ATUFL_M1_KS5A]|uniref:hypothetical protein n=1 Tax=Caballeronia sp. ATUFL_M1_KS5A TaxID=2921778 RepID=UPI002028505A|nr:hypothetical protein [Caballeronia sp. ATUFL_M1_KS5A]